MELFCGESAHFGSPLSESGDHRAEDEDGDLLVKSYGNVMGIMLNHG